MQDFVVLATLLREVSFGILLVGLFYTFGMFFLGRLFSAIAEHGHDVDVDHDVDPDIDHSVEHDYDMDHGEIDHDYDVDHGEIDHDIDHDYEASHEVEHDYEVDHGEIDHDIDHEIDHDVSHELEHDIDHHVIDHDVADHDVGHEHDLDHDVGFDHDIEVEKSGFFETERGAPLGVTIGTTLVSFGFLGSLLYYDGIVIPLIGKIVLHVFGAALVVLSMRTILGKVFVESGFMITPKHLVGREAEAVSTIRDDFGEARVETEMGLRRFLARPFQKGVVFQKGTKLYVVSADEKFVYVDPRKEVVRWLQKQSKKPPEESKKKASS